MGPTWGPSGADRTQVGPMLVPWTLPSGMFSSIRKLSVGIIYNTRCCLDAFYYTSACSWHSTGLVCSKRISRYGLFAATSNQISNILLLSCYELFTNKERLTLPHLWWAFRSDSPLCLCTTVSLWNILYQIMNEDWPKCDDCKLHLQNNDLLVMIFVWYIYNALVTI